MRLMMTFALCALPLAGAAETGQPYAGQQGRDIATLSEADVTAILAGEGWGLAKPAELSGYPGPAHVLELAEALELTEDQRTQVQRAYDMMRAEAQDAGAAYVESERHLTRMFRAGHADPEMLATALQSSAAAFARLREVHLAAHLAVTPLLSDEQKETYAQMRGYDGAAGGTDHQGHAQH
ncbi:Spy/CpxP family protein refolding chaperone [Salipiger mucosus]|uniref:Periplasmic heavy metal sensor n=1 Tax=Salipiger mucosus DSM 16094 TaxID=1123237 RepID=S9SKQ1_9RHOB|nr:Spy/CpxP family protein refolding chaperone [Salipiger mucosus]EPX86954.1 hypothetical protein Salmuc_02929 [Salipiger mucosus DSM 16094]